MVRPRPASEKHIELFHSGHFVQYVKKISEFELEKEYNEEEAEQYGLSSFYLAHKTDINFCYKFYV